MVKGLSPDSGVEIPMAFAERFAQLVLENREQVDPALGSEISIHRLTPGVDPKTFLPSLEITATWNLEPIHDHQPRRSPQDSGTSMAQRHGNLQIKGTNMTEKPIKIPVSTRVMPSIIAENIKGVSPMIGAVETKPMITERQGEGQVDVEVDPVTGKRVIKIDINDDITPEKALEFTKKVLKGLNG